IPISISFTVETDGRLPSEEPLGEAIERVDGETAGAAAYFMVNCAHPTHFAADLDRGGAWLERLAGVRANASRRSHVELDEMDSRGGGGRAGRGGECGAGARKLPTTGVGGGCGGTDARHIAAICDAWPG